MIVVLFLLARSLPEGGLQFSANPLIRARHRPANQAPRGAAEDPDDPQRRSGDVKSSGPLFRGFVVVDARAAMRRNRCSPAFRKMPAGCNPAQIDFSSGLAIAPSQRTFSGFQPRGCPTTDRDIALLPEKSAEDFSRMGCLQAASASRLWCPIRNYCRRHVAVLLTFANVLECFGLLARNDTTDAILRPGAARPLPILVTRARHPSLRVRHRLRWDAQLSGRVAVVRGQVLVKLQLRMSSSAVKPPVAPVKPTCALGPPTSAGMFTA